MKFSKSKILIVLAVLISGGAAFWYFFQQPEGLKTPPGISPETPSETLSSQSSLSYTFSARAEKFVISGGEDYPVFAKELIVDPFKVKEGETQYFSIWAKDPVGIEKVTATVKTDSGDRALDSELVEGTKEEGRWMVSWLTKDISLGTTYSTEILAINKNGKDTKLTISWYHQEE